MGKMIDVSLSSDVRIMAAIPSTLDYMHELPAVHFAKEDEAHCTRIFICHLFYKMSGLVLITL